MYLIYYSIVKPMNLNANIVDVVRTQESHKKALLRLGIQTVKDLLYYFPSRYSHMSTVTSIAQSSSDDVVTIYGVLSNIRIKKTYRTNIPTAQATLTDLQNNTVKIIWFNQAFIAKTLIEGQMVKLTGKISEGNYGKTLTNPEFEKLSSFPIDTGDSLFNTSNEAKEFGYPVYRESKGITSKWIYHTVISILGSGILETLEDPLPVYLLQKYKLPSLQTALVWIHSPQSSNHAKAAQKRFAFEEIFLIQLKNQQRRLSYQKHFSYQLQAEQKTIQSFIDRFPFTPTEAQYEAVQSIINDMTSSHPMSRLLEGDVGSGKTFVAATAAYATVMNRPGSKSYGRLQVAYMAPTEVLATQLFENFVTYFTGLGIQIGLLTGSGCRKFPSKVPGETWTTISRSQLSKWIANGEIPIVIGTHTLIQKKVAFQDLALAIIDEQHRFGTKQRMKLGTKEKRIPHFLSMTATPIPRTLALTIYGDLDLSVIDTMPQGRKQVITEIVSPDTNSRNKVYEAIRSSLKAGRQAYVICPRIDEPDPSKEQTLQLTSVKAEAQRLQRTVFPEFRIDIMHSKMTKAQKEQVMEKFYNHEIDILVSTSVVEVGVNVPNATSIIIEGAERFGLAQLHQLRGRVIRSEHQAYCYLFADAKSEKTIERLQAIQRAKNGFELAEMDMMQRGIGDLAGVKQWGISDLAMEAIKNIKMVEFARSEAQQIIEHDPLLDNFPELKEIIRQDHYDIHFE